MNLAEMATYLRERHTFDLTRVETLPYYNADSDGEDYRRFLTDPKATGPTVDKSGWLATLRSDTDGHKRWRRVRLVRDPLTDYERYSCTWGYPDNVAAGEDVRILQVTDESRLDQLVGDFFVVDNEHVVLTYYDAAGRHAGAEVVDGRESAALIAVRDLAWGRAVPFTDWWNAHPEYSRARQVA
ncbi:MAG: hypothetical protein L0I76_28250 [Pseudonocardia sp.]|nr:hypothetical protein [Pseudonocardia sp.]MDN5932058.1 hypothetical protein [Pseudonocardia sp.]